MRLIIIINVFFEVEGFNEEKYDAMYKGGDG